jgi:class 3 adenylate cyclase
MSTEPVRAEASLLISFIDLTQYQTQARKSSDAQLAETMNEFYGLITIAIHQAGGRVVKFIGDAALLVFPQEKIDEGVAALLSLKTRLDAWLSAQGWASRLVVKAHFGTVIAGLFGPKEEQRFDVIGKEVNTTATLESSGLALSAELFRRLSPQMRTHFKKHTPPITYIRVEDTHR